MEMTSSVRFFYENTPSIDRTATIQRAIKTFPTIGESLYTLKRRNSIFVHQYDNKRKRNFYRRKYIFPPNRDRVFLSKHESYFLKWTYDKGLLILLDVSANVRNEPIKKWKTLEARSSSFARREDGLFYKILDLILFFDAPYF